MLDFSSDKSIYIQIAEAIENEIITGNLTDDDQAPSTNKFAQVYHINPATAGKGLNMLVDEGILYKKRGIGMFVASGARSKIIKKRQDVFFKEILPEIIREANRLDIPTIDIVKYIEEYKGGK